MNYEFSEKVTSLKPSAIREILKFSSEPGVIPFSAGNPAPEAFPSKEIAEITSHILSTSPVSALQYSITEGYTPLREALKKKLEKEHSFNPEIDDLIITSGGQQASELSCKSFLNPGEALVCEAPSFVGCLNAFKSYNSKLIGINLENDGMNLEELEKVLKSEKVKLIYIIANFQNPMGICTSLEKRKAVYALAQKYNTMILEDNPYGDIRFSGENIPSIKSLDTDGRVIYAGSFSKVVAPGMRVGFAAAPKEVIQKLVICKQVSDVHTNILAQMICHEYMTKYDFDKHLNDIRKIYRHKCELMLSAMDENFSEKVTYTRPEGGLFIWATLSEGSDMNAFCKKAVAEYKVAVVPGNAFMINDNDKTSSFRLNYSTPTDEDIVKGCEILGKLTKEL